MRLSLLRASAWAATNGQRHRSALIVGAGVAGPALADFLHRVGVKSVVVERSSELRTSGQTVDIRDAAREVVRRMGVDSAIRERTTKEDGLFVVDRKGQIRAAFGSDSFGGEGLVSEIEILRGELVNLLYERSRNHTEYIFDDHPSAINDEGNAVQVTFASGNTRRFDYVIGADGIRSKTRRIVFGDKSVIRPLDIYTSYFTIPHNQSDGSWARLYSAPKRRTVFLRPDNQGTTRAVLGFGSKERGYEDLPVDKQKDLLEKVFMDAGFETPRVLSEMRKTNDFYFEAIGQVKMDQWSKGRVTLLGDAAYCPSPITGMGTCVALVGAYILAGEMGRHQEHVKAFSEYETIMRPYVTKIQKIIPGSTRIFAPQTATAIALRNRMLSIAARPAVMRVIEKLMATKTADTISLPDYESLRTR